MTTSTYNKTYTNGNKQIEIDLRDGKYNVYTNVFDGVKWQTGSRKIYKTLNMAHKEANKRTADFTASWTQYPEWTISYA